MGGGSKRESVGVRGTREGKRDWREVMREEGDGSEGVGGDKRNVGERERKI